MRNLLAANFRRLFRNRMFWILAGLLVLAGAFFPARAFFTMRRIGYATVLDEEFFVYTYFVALAASVLVALFVGTEYHDGTIRNKLIAGHRRGAIYLANLLTCLAATGLLCLAYIIPYLGVGLPLLGGFAVGIKSVAIYIALSFCMAAAFAALYICIAMLCQSRSHTAIFCMLLALVLLVVGVYLQACLEAPEYLEGYTLSVDGAVVPMEKEPNPRYITGTQRTVYEFLMDFLPGGQTLQLCAGSVKRPVQMAAYAIFIVMAATCMGIWRFRRKDIK